MEFPILPKDLAQWNFNPTSTMVAFVQREKPGLVKTTETDPEITIDREQLFPLELEFISTALDYIRVPKQFMLKQSEWNALQPTITLGTAVTGSLIGLTLAPIITFPLTVAGSLTMGVLAGSISAGLLGLIGTSLGASAGSLSGNIISSIAISVGAIAIALISAIGFGVGGLLWGALFGAIILAVIGGATGVGVGGLIGAAAFLIGTIWGVPVGVAAGAILGTIVGVPIGAAMLGGIGAVFGVVVGLIAGLLILTPGSSLSGISSGSASSFMSGAGSFFVTGVNIFWIVSALAASLIFLTTPILLILTLAIFGAIIGYTYINNIKPRRLKTAREITYRFKTIYLANAPIPTQIISYSERSTQAVNQLPREILVLN